MSRYYNWFESVTPAEFPERYTEDTERADRENDAAAVGYGKRPLFHVPTTWAQLQAAINGELQCCECAVRVVGDVQEEFVCPLCEGEA